MSVYCDSAFLIWLWLGQSRKRLNEDVYRESHVMSKAARQEPDLGFDGISQSLNDIYFVILIFLYILILNLLTVSNQCHTQ